MESKEKKTATKNEKSYPGVAIDVADDNEVTEKTLKQDVKKLGFNPRNEGNPV